MKHVLLIAALLLFTLGLVLLAIGDTHTPVPTAGGGSVVAVNGFYGATGRALTLIGLLLALLYVLQERRRRRRRQRNSREVRCPKCGYSLRGLRRAQCPECGHEFTLDEVALSA